MELGEFGHGTGFDIAALVTAPGDKTGTPGNPAGESVPTPIGLTAHIAHLTERHVHNIITAATRQAVPKICIILTEIL